MPDLALLTRRLERLEEQLSSLRTCRDRGARAVTEDPALRKQVERDLQISAQCMIDIAAHLVADWNLGAAEDYRGLFALLETSGRMDPGLAARMREWAGFRNVLVHLYVDVDPERIARAVTEGLRDIEAFMKWLEPVVDALRVRPGAR